MSFLLILPPGESYEISFLLCLHPFFAISSLTGRLATSTPNSGRKNGTLKMRSKSLKQSRPQQKGVGLVNPGLARGLIFSVIPLSDGNCFFDSLPAPHKKNNRYSVRAPILYPFLILMSDLFGNFCIVISFGIFLYDLSTVYRSSNDPEVRAFSFRMTRSL